MKTVYITIPLLAAALLLSALPASAEHTKDGQCSASEFIGKKVKGSQDEDLGKVQDLIINFESGTVPYAIISHGGVLGAGATRTAVPLDSLKPSADGKALMMMATKEQLQSANRSAEGWGNATNQTWARGIDRFYGTPANPEYRNGRDKMSTDNPDKTYVRDSVPKGAELLMTPADQALSEKIADGAKVVYVRVQNGVTYLHGEVEDENARNDLERRVRAVPGVNRVESRLTVKNP